MSACCLWVVHAESEHEIRVRERESAGNKLGGAGGEHVREMRARPSRTMMRGKHVCQRMANGTMRRRAMLPHPFRVEPLQFSRLARTSCTRGMETEGICGGELVTMVLHKPYI